VGGFGIKWLLMALGDGGRPDLSYALMTKTDYPSYGYMLTQNATTIWESWSYSDNTLSHNHPMFAGPTTYMFQSLAGLRVGAGARGADLLDLRPQPPPAAAGLQWVNASWVTVRGEVSSHWQWQSPTTLFLRLVLPPNMQATLTLPLSATQHSIGSGAWEFTDSSA
jgi:alpha-L-rhamnosidase